MTEIVTKPDAKSPIIIVGEGGIGVATDTLQTFFDDIELRLNAALLGSRVRLESYTVAGLPPPAEGVGVAFVTDEVGGPTLAFSDGTNWRRTTDRAVVS